MIGLPRDLPAHATQPARNLLIFLDLNSGISLALEPLRGRLRSGVANSTAPSSRAPVRSGALGAPRRTVATRGSRPLGCRNSSAHPGHRVSRWQERALRAGEAAQGGNVRMTNGRLRRGLGMRLSSKIFLSSTLVIVVLAGVSALSLGAVGRLVSVNREITTRTIPVLSLTASAREAIQPLLGLEARAVVLGDRRYATAWTALAARLAEDLERLAEYALSEREALHLREASAAFEEYRRIVAEEQALLGRGDRARAVRLTDAAARVLGEQVRESLDGLMAATRARVLAAQTEAAHLEARTWTAVLIALGAAVGLALLGAAIIARRMTRSLDLLSSATAEVAARAFPEPIAAASRDEIGAPPRPFKPMGRQLRQMEETKREFFATVSHELRSPLPSIRGAVDLLHERAPAPLTEKQERLSGIIAQSSERLPRLAKQILQTSRLRAALVEVERKPLDLAMLVDRVVEELHPQAEEAGGALERERYGPDLAYLGGEERPHQRVGH